jgi:hypothetical protein
MRVSAQACMVGHGIGNVLYRGSQRSPRDVPPGGVGVSPCRWVAIGYAARLAVAAVVWLLTGRFIWRRRQALLPPDPPTGENSSQPARAAPAPVVLRARRHLSGSARATCRTWAPGGLKPGLESLGRPCCITTEAPVSAYAGILTPRTSTTGAERIARFVPTASAGGETTGGSCASSRGWSADLDGKISRPATATFSTETGEHRRVAASASPRLRALKYPHCRPDPNGRGWAGAARGRPGGAGPAGPEPASRWPGRAGKAGWGGGGGRRGARGG